MIPRDYITQWRARAPWVEDFQVEQDLVISRALVEIFSHPHLRESLAFRGGTALYKLHIDPPARYSSDNQSVSSIEDQFRICRDQADVAILYKHFTFAGVALVTLSMKTYGRRRGGGNYGVITRDRYGCLNRYRRRTCDNGYTIRRDDIEQRILSGLTERLISADRVAKAVRAYAEALNSQNRERRAQAQFDRKALADGVPVMVIVLILTTARLRLARDRFGLLGSIRQCFWRAGFQSVPHRRHGRVPCREWPMARPA